MDKKLKIYIGVFILSILSILYLEGTKSKSINWYPSYAAKHKIPYGTYVLRKELPTLFSKKEVKDIREAPYVFLQDSTKEGTYFFVDANINFDKEEFDEVLSFVKRGNDVFLSTRRAFIDTLHIETKRASSSAFKEKTYVALANKQFGNQEFLFDREFDKSIFSEIDTLNTTVLGELVLRDQNDSIVGREPNFIKVKNGKGNLFIHVFPEAFTNYNMLLEDNNTYVASVLSYLDDEKPILWDAYYKTGKSSISSPMYYILSSKHLKWAYYVALLGVLFFIVFKGKRNQRYIPVVTPLKNQTVAFTRTIANMYYEKSEHKNIAEHKINYFLEFIRNRYKIATLKIDEEFYKKLASRSSTTEEDVKKLFTLINNIQQQATITKETLIELNTKIEAFKTS